MKNVVITFAETMKSIMSKAWYIVKTYGWSMSEALKRAWQLAKMKLEMSKRIVEFTFTKVDGSTRQAWGTLCERIIPTHNAEGAKRKPNNSVFTYWDMEKGDWRCFKVANLVDVKW